MSFEFKKNKETKIYIDSNEPLSLRLAVDDLANDIRALFGPVSIINDQMKADILVASDDSFNYDEEYFYSIMTSRIYLTGKGDLGAMWAIYAFIENELNIHSFYKIEGLKLSQRNSLILVDKTVNAHPETKFRGWFINDEDLLSEFKPGGTRDIDYPFYKHVISKEMMNVIAETALRNKINLIIPSTLVDITNDSERALVDVCSRRGLYVSQHHIEPLGVSKYGFVKYAKQNNLDENFSYISNKDALLSCYEKYVQEWAKYPRVIYQLGLRGGSDRPVWEGDKNVSENEEDRGELISNAIKDQYEILTKYVQDEIYSTSTLWMEGSNLHKNGFLKFPKSTTIVFSDIGMSSMFGNDFYTIKRKENRTYGVYYHAGYWHTGAHLADSLNPSKMSYCYKEILNSNSSYYSMINVANIKELTFSIFLNANLCWNHNLNIEELMHKYAKFYTICSENELYSLIKKYFDSFLDVGENEYELFCKKYNFDYRKYEGVLFPVININDGMIRSSHYLYFDDLKRICTPIVKTALEAGSKNMECLYKNFKELSNDIDEDYLVGYKQHFEYQTYYMYKMFMEGLNYFKGVESFINGDLQAEDEYFANAKECLNDILKIRKKYYYDEWANYFVGDAKIGVKDLINRLDCLKNEIIK